MSKTLCRVAWVDYTPKQDDGSDPTVRVCGRSADGERTVRYVRGTRPHCYVHADEMPAVGGLDDVDVRSVEAGYESYDGVPLARVTFRHPKETNAVKDEFGTWEADIPFYRRATWDYGLAGYIRVPEETNVHVDDIETDIDAEDVDPIEPRVVIGDIEVLHDGEKTFEEMTDAVEDPIIAVSLYDTYTEEFVLGVVDPEGEAEGSDVKSEMGDHWGDHDLREQYVDDAEITFVQAASETDLINTVIGTIQSWRPDLVSGWNWIDFDHAYLTDRARKLDDVDEHALSDIGGVGGRSVEQRIKGLPAFDQMAAYDDKVTRSENRSNALEYVANEELGIGKIDAVDVATAYEDDRSRLAAYNLLDVQLCAALTDKHAIEEFYMDLGDLTGIQVYDVFYEKRLVDGWIASRTDDDQVLPNQFERDIPEPAGGLVLSPSQGVTEDVAVLDLKSLYPSSGITMNISPETMVDDPEAADVVIPGMPEKAEDVGGAVEPTDINWDDWDADLPWSQRPKGFNLDDQGIVAEAMEGPFEERGRYKTLRDDFGPNDEYYVVYDRKQGAVKVVHNSMFGVLGSDYYRLAEAGVADAITGVSRYVLWRGAEHLEEQGYDVIYGDTDSVLVDMSSYEEDRSLEEYLLDSKGLVNQLNGHMSTVAEDLGLPEDHPFVDASEMPHDLPDDVNHLWYFEFEKFYESFIQCGSKKRYAGKLGWKEGKTVDDDAEPDVTGFESQRADVPKRTAEVQNETIKRVLAGQTFSQVSDYVREQIEAIREMGSLDEIGIPKSLSKPLDEYPNMPRVRAARHSNRHLGESYGPGDTMWMFYAARTPVGVEGTDVFGIDWNGEIPEGYEVDEEQTITKAFESALTPIIEEVGWTFEEIRAGKQAQAAEESTGFDGDPFASEATPEGSDGGDEWAGAESW
jgi:DNA polymerase elongation subunit (family B)